MPHDQTFYVGQKAFIEKDGEVLTLCLTTNQFDIPGGKIQEGEDDLETALIREVQEEIGIEIEINEPFYTWHFTFPSNHPEPGKKVFLVGYRCKYISGEPRLSHEHTSF